MDHINVIEFESEAPYKWRRLALILLLDKDHSDRGFNGYCLDALDEIPAGGMQSDCIDRGWPRPLRCKRGVSLAEVQHRNAIADEIIDEILREEAQQKGQS